MAVTMRAAGLASGEPHYGILSRDSDGKVWNGSTFVTYATADRVDYAITFTELGDDSGIFTATAPVEADGSYSYDVYQELGMIGVAETDTYCGSGAFTPTFRHGAPSNFVPDTEVARQQQYRAAMREIIAVDSGKNGVTVLPGDFSIWEMFSLNPGLLADGIHPTNPIGYGVLGLRDAMWWYSWWHGGVTSLRGLL